MAPELENRKFVAPAALTYNGIISPALFEITPEKFYVTIFEREESFTIQVNWPVACIKKECLSEFLLDDIKQIIENQGIDRAIMSVDRYLKSSALYADTENDEVVILLLMPSGPEPLTLSYSSVSPK